MRVILVLALALWGFGAFVMAEALPADCTKVGTIGADIIAGTAGADRICAEAGRDYVHGAAGRDVIFGMGDRDTLVAGNGRDVLKGGGGGDKLFSIDQRHGNDVIYGGMGKDNCFADKGDRVIGCEIVHRVSTPKAAEAVIRALDNAFLGLTILGESFQDALGAPGPPGPPGAGPPFPNCPSPADATPAVCP
jgi:hypothetical protein